MNTLFGELKEIKYRKINCRFRTKEDLDAFNEMNGLSLKENISEYNYNTKDMIGIKPTKSGAKDIPYWRTQWKEMPEFFCNSQECFAKITFLFDEDKEDLESMSKFFGQSITDQTVSVWYPKLDISKHCERFLGGDLLPKYPVYVVSKGRWDRCYTSIALAQMEVPHYIVVEPNEVELYKKHNNSPYVTVLELDMDYKKNYDTFDDLGDTKSKGPGGARNFVWDDSIKKGFAWHWVMDDNCNEGFHRFYGARRIRCVSGAMLRSCEDFVERYDNVAQAGLNYSKFCVDYCDYPAFVTNTRIYSFLFIRNDIPYRWRGRYNEDTDLSLRILKDGWCTIQFNHFLAGKATTQKISGGNTAEFYAEEGTYPKSKMLEDMHPDVAKVVWKFHRWHHYVNYSGFTQRLHLKDEYKNLSDEPNNYGLKCVMIDESDYNLTTPKSVLEAKYLKDGNEVIIKDTSPGYKKVRTLF